MVLHVRMVYAPDHCCAVVVVMIHADVTSNLLNSRSREDLRIG